MNPAVETELNLKLPREAKQNISTTKTMGILKHPQILNGGI
jgi:hypothetical protein